MRHFLNLSDAGADGVAAMLADAIDRKAARAGFPKGRADADAPLAGHVLAMIFEKNSTRTRVSFDMAMRQLGGATIVLEGASSQLGRGEPIADTARVLSRYVDAIMIRTDDHAKAEELADHATVPVINGLTDLSHPCQILADMQTVIERRFKLAGSKWGWVGDGNNVCNSLVEAAALMQITSSAARLMATAKAVVTSGATSSAVTTLDNTVSESDTGSDFQNSTLRSLRSSNRLARQ